MLFKTMSWMSTHLFNISLFLSFSFFHYLLLVQVSIICQRCVKQHVARDAVHAVPSCFQGAVSHIKQLQARHSGEGNYVHTHTRPHTDKHIAQFKIEEWSYEQRLLIWCWLSEVCQYCNFCGNVRKWYLFGCFYLLVLWMHRCQYVRLPWLSNF